jgi:integrase/recombinase XerD
MKKNNIFGPWIKRFLTEYLVTEKNYSYNTQQSYRDTLCLFLPFIARCIRKGIDQIQIEDITPGLIRSFLLELEKKRQSSPVTRNQRLATIRSLANYIALNNPEYIEWCTGIKSVPLKKTERSEITYLERYEMDALLNAPDCSTTLGKRDHAILLFLYNTGARADEISQLLIEDLNISKKSDSHLASVRILGKGKKIRHCPLWKQTVKEIYPLIKGRATTEHVFLNRTGQPITRFGIHSLVQRYVKEASTTTPSLTKKQISPHTIRHTTATHLLRSGVDINTIRAWLGHVSLNTTNIYAEIDLEMKARALTNCEPQKSKDTKPWKKDAELMDFLKNL